MPTIRRDRVEPYTAKEMYNLVNDVVSYPEFLPWCRSAKVLKETETMMEASILMAKGPLNKWFTTKNDLTPDSEIVLNLVDGPFKYLHGSWKFIDLEKGGCEVKFMIEFDFAFGPARMLLTPIFEGITNSLVNAFSKQARIIYGIKTTQNNLSQ